MQITNKLNFPDAIVRAVKNDGYTKGNADFSVTELLKPARQRALQRKHYHDLVEDVSDLIFSLLGRVIHGILEKANALDIAERRLEVKVMDKVISGGMDLYTSDGVLSDYKLAPVAKFYNGVPKDFVAQLNIYAEILRQHGHFVRKLEVIAILRDWSRTRTRNPEYPPAQVIKMDVAMWERKEVLAFLEERIKAHMDAEKTLPLCTNEERWARNTKYAVKKKGRKTAVRVFETSFEAEELNKKEPDYYIERRPGESIRCEYYCNVNKFCDQFKTMKGME